MAAGQSLESQRRAGGSAGGGRAWCPASLAALRNTKGYMRASERRRVRWWRDGRRPRACARSVFSSEEDCAQLGDLLLSEPSFVAREERGRRP